MLNLALQSRCVQSSAEAGGCCPAKAAGRTTSEGPSEKMQGKHNGHGTLDNCRKGIAAVFRNHRNCLEGLRDIAFGISTEIDTLSTFLQPHTAAVCPECTSVCCINRHSRHTFDDMVYLAARGAHIPPSTAERDDSAPCHFLGDGGCRISRDVRPYRCTWYFCSPLLEHIAEHHPSRQYRSFINLLERITRKRQRMMEEYDSVMSTLLPG